MEKILPAIAANAAQIFIVFTGLFYLCLSFFGFAGLKRPGKASKERRFAMLMPAHDEENVIGYALQSLFRQHYPRELFDVYVIADHCSDGTESKAAAAGAAVLSYCDPCLRAGKGRALKWATPQVLAGGRYDALCYFDADSLAHPDFLKVINDYLEDGAEAVQGRQVAKNTDCWLARILAAGHLVSNRFCHHPKEVLGLSSVFHGKGICLTAGIAERYPWDEHCLTEDLELQMRLVRAGVRIRWARDAVVFDEEPATLEQYVRRTVRWTRGAIDTALRHMPAVFARSFRLRDAAAFEAALYSSQAFRMMIVAFLAAATWLSRDSFSVFTWIYHNLPPVALRIKMMSVTPLLLYPALALPLEKAAP